MFIRKGDTRIVFIFKNFVIKLPKPTNLIEGIKANWREWRIWRQVSTSFDEVFFARLLFTFPGLFLIMERADPVVGSLPRPQQFFETLRERFHLMGDLCAANIGWDAASNPIVIDYGGPQFVNSDRTEGNEGPGKDGWID